MATKGRSGRDLGGLGPAAGQAAKIEPLGAGTPRSPRNWSKRVFRSRGAVAEINNVGLISRTVMKSFLSADRRIPHVRNSVRKTLACANLCRETTEDMNWKLYAPNSPSLYVKQYDTKTKRTRCPPFGRHKRIRMETASEGLSKKRYATMLSAAVARPGAMDQHNAVELCSSPRKSHGEGFEDLGQSQNSLEDVITALAGSGGGGGAPAAASATVLHEVAELMSRRRAGASLERSFLSDRRSLFGSGSFASFTVTT